MKEPIEQIEKFTKVNVTKFLDKNIKYWKGKKNKYDEERRKIDTKFPSMESTQELKALYFIEAYQDIRFAIIGDRLWENLKILKL